MKSPIPLIAKLPRFRSLESGRGSSPWDEVPLQGGVSKFQAPFSIKTRRRGHRLRVIEPEITHLKKGQSARHKDGAKKSVPWIFSLILCFLLGLYVMDPFLYGWHKSEAIRTYLYLHNYGAGTATGKLIASGIFSQDEIAAMNRKQGSFQDYFATPEAADLKATSIVDLHGQRPRLLHDGKYDKLDPLGRMRYLLFIRTGIPLPQSWSSLLDPYHWRLSPYPRACAKAQRKQHYRRVIFRSTI